MKLAELTYSFTCKVNLGNYESCDVFLAAKALVEEGENPESVYAELREWVKGKVREERREIKERK